ncbi:uncharacterized protein LACBIDRAFT_296772 [Laccaria bicolor S238N-H82]|uniref:Predicted protein n=1 Tax=Laccaria bicolor (strain S238N-H82 / ATCC MYA-4686) TaxID=486041 RepID=B0E327_LACBS|nr:uncharacterized protein LACBIDRAFT_296772 [Laccaria bicolor S238N-H82]EDQ98747.1 predicted protein [Laccaria bicolor S238N-H82]|eukprot:XP_001890596.1 predicted protein [Laccaria bicolor S238N-H82]
MLAALYTRSVKHTNVFTFHTTSIVASPNVLVVSSGGSYLCSINQVSHSNCTHKAHRLGQSKRVTQHQILEGQQIIFDLELPKSSSFREHLDSIALYRNSDADVLAKWLYVLLFDKVTVRWRLAVTTASDALLVCRLDAQFLDVDIARFLALRGIPFRTLLTELLMPRSILYPDVELFLPQHPAGYHFTKLDYEAYLQCRSRILRRPRVRAAILHGGFL